jgi:tRNA pseudouridine13 synthase
MRLSALFVSELEKSLGIEVYATRSRGIGGVIRRSCEDFVVEEILVDGSKAEIASSTKQVLGSSSLRSRYLLCVLVKRNWDTFSAVKAVADQLNMKPSCIQIAGIKDAKAVTAQHVTIENASVEDVVKVEVKDVEVRPVGYVRSGLSSFYLLGNSFRITVKGIKRSESAIRMQVARIIKELETLGGVPNFFGHQRFGTARPVTHLVGEAIVRSDFREAAMLFLAKSSQHEHPSSRQAREELQKTEDFKRGLQVFPRQLRYERLMLEHLAEEPDDFVGAFRRLPLKLRELFPQACQSYLFNRFLSGRIASGLPLDKADCGDYVVGVERSGLPASTMRRMASAETLAEINEAVKVGRMCIALPLVGFRQRLSEGCQGKIEKQVLREEQINPANFHFDAMSEISLRGGLRTAVAPLNDFSLEVAVDSENPSSHMMRVGFTLHRSSYATVVLREIMKPRDLLKAGF